MADFGFIDSTYPNGTQYQQVSLNGIVLGYLVKAEDCYTSPGWRKPAASKAVALEKLRAAGIAERKRQIATLQGEIDRLTT